MFVLMLICWLIVCSCYVCWNCLDNMNVCWYCMRLCVVVGWIVFCNCCRLVWIFMVCLICNGVISVVWLCWWWCCLICVCCVN